MLNSFWRHFDSLYMSSYALELKLRNFDPYDHNPLPLNRSLYARNSSRYVHIYIQRYIFKNQNVMKNEKEKERKKQRSEKKIVVQGQKRDEIWA